MSGDQTFIFNPRQALLYNLPLKGLYCFPLHRHVFTLIQHLFCTAAQVHLCHRETKPVISTNTAVKGAAGLLPAQECSLAGSLVMPVPLLSSLFFSSTA